MPTASGESATEVRHGVLDARARPRRRVQDRRHARAHRGRARAGRSGPGEVHAARAEPRARAARGDGPRGRRADRGRAGARACHPTARGRGRRPGRGPRRRSVADERDPGRDQHPRLRRGHHLDAAGAGLEVAEARPAEQDHRPRAAGYHPHRARPAVRAGKLAEQVAERLLRRPERELVPRQLARREGADLRRLRRRPRLAVRRRVEDDEHHAVLRARVDADEAGELDVDLELLLRLAPRGLLDRLAEVDDPAGERPSPRGRVEPAAQEPDAAIRLARDRPGDGLGVVERGVAAVVAVQRAREVDARRRAAAGAELRALERRVDAVGVEVRAGGVVVVVVAHRSVSPGGTRSGRCRPSWRAASATAAATCRCTARSSGLGMSQLSRVSRAIARAAASFIPVEIVRAPHDRAPRKMPGNASALLIAAPSAANAAPARSATCGSISGAGFVRAETAWPSRTLSEPMRPGWPVAATTMWARAITDSKSVISMPLASAWVWASLSGSVAMTLSAPAARARHAVPKPAAPRPIWPTVCSESGRPSVAHAVMIAATAATAAAWTSECMTGTSRASMRRASISKHSGTRMSSRWMAPKLGAMLRTVRTKSSGWFSAMSSGTALRSVNAV